MAGRWRDIGPDDLRDMLPPGDGTWALAGGYALEAALPGHTREHSDIEIACFRSALPALLDELSDFEIVVARNRHLTPLDRTAPLPPPQFSLWLRTPGEELWDFEILIEDRDGEDWVYRRSPAIRRPPASVFLPPAQAGGPWIVAPEVQLLYKSKAPREKDLWDFRQYWSMLDSAAQVWLRSAIRQAHPDFLPELVAIDASQP